MKKLTILPDFNENDFLRFSILWSKARDCQIDFTNLKHEFELIRCARIALAFPNTQFAHALLEYIAENEETPSEILKEILILGDKGCKETICLRSDLNEELSNLCSELNLVHNP